ncbi:hypothetical protein H5410_048095 [Solanum commersonii]|uniref:Uncharacterized protein n=1 Tax=Solanum commersonii TaxID=4109 RepID=A0A9J5XIT4_SOLCO|nr:hypothetical protein H5410_048095 [Solanum commersonii]
MSCQASEVCGLVFCPLPWGWCSGAHGGRSYLVVVCPRRKRWVWLEMAFLRPKGFGSNMIYRLM